VTNLIAIHQPNYLPWPGLFHKWMEADAFILLDTVQYHKNEWQNRNRMKGCQGAQWLTTPVHYHFGQHICELELAASNWAKKQSTAIAQAYARAPYFDRYWSPLRDLLAQAACERWRLGMLNSAVIRLLGAQLGCGAPLYIASEMDSASEDPTERLIGLCQQLGGSGYLSGSEGRNYLRRDAFVAAGLRLCFQQVEAPIYPQLHGVFVSHLSVIDLLYNVGEQAGDVVRNMGEVVSS
ncbi:MAG: WbqC family protein, partial [Mariprofundales bacterium]|nr:WbqC family protein [Mariprofundales bacterium]